MNNPFPRGIPRAAFLFTGIASMITAFTAKACGASPWVFYTFLCLWFTLKSTFIVLSIRAGAFKMSGPLVMLMVGVGLALVSLYFKYVLLWMVVARVLLFTGVTLKLLAVGLIMWRKRKKQ